MWYQFFFSVNNICVQTWAWKHHRIIEREYEGDSLNRFPPRFIGMPGRRKVGILFDFLWNCASNASKLKLWKFIEFGGHIQLNFEESGGLLIVSTVLEFKTFMLLSASRSWLLWSFVLVSVTKTLLGSSPWVAGILLLFITTLFSDFNRLKSLFGNLLIRMLRNALKL